ncbi:MAG: hypothetical protein ACFCD0_18655 [Gemmataceae bacterium]
MAKNEDIKVFRTFDDFLPPEMFERLLMLNKTVGWTYDERIIWFFVDTSAEPLIQEIVGVANEKTGIRHELNRAYANGMINRSIAKGHFDTHQEADRTLLIYGHAKWETENWGGETVFNNPIDTWIKSKPNSAVYFSSKHHWHRAYAPQPGCEVYRITHVLKLLSLD